MAKLGEESKIASTDKGNDYAEARLDTGSGKSQAQEPGDGKDWQYADAELDVRNDGDDMPSRPGTPSESVAAALSRRK